MSKSNPRPGISVRIDQDTLDDLDRLAKYFNLTRSAVINMVLSTSLPKYLAKMAKETKAQ